jgi:pyrroloquinoline quinone biosynthesis protein B
MNKYLVIISILFVSCIKIPDKQIQQKSLENQNTSLVILGNVQDAGSPQIGCKKKCCKKLFQSPDKNRKVVSLGLVDGENHKTYLFDATPDISSQIKTLTQLEKVDSSEFTDGIFLTHAHIGHYSGLIYLGKEATDAQNIPVYVMPRMEDFLSNNGPWSQLVKRENIILQKMTPNKPIHISDSISVTPILVPHRDEYSETVGYRIKGPNKSALFIPDIDKWEKWDRNIIEEIKQVDYAFLDATFYSGKEINNRDISHIPHPFVIESLQKFKNLSPSEKNKIIFIHFNHTNPLLDEESQESNYVIRQGYNIGRINDNFEM